MRRKTSTYSVSSIIMDLLSRDSWIKTSSVKYFPPLSAIPLQLLTLLITLSGSQWRRNLIECTVFTSNVAGFNPTPFAASYASAKAFISQFAACIYTEIKNHEIDVCDVHPSPIASNLYNVVDHRIELMEAAHKSVVPPSGLSNEIFKVVGVYALRDFRGMGLIVLEANTHQETVVSINNVVWRTCVSYQ